MMGMRMTMKLGEFVTLPLLLVVIDFVNGLKYGPSLTSLSSHVLKLEDYPNYSVLVPLARHRTKAYPYELHHENTHWRDIKAVIKAPDGFRVMMVIQALYLGVGYGEKLQKDFAENGIKPCVDSLQVYENDDLVEDICGSVNETDKSAFPKGLSGPRALVSKGSSLIVGLQFGKKLRVSAESHWTASLEYHHRIDIWDRKFALSVAFTAFKDCEDLSKTSNELDDFRACSNPSLSSENSEISEICISSKLFCDGVMNCVNLKGFDRIGDDENEFVCRGFLNKESLTMSSPMHMRNNYEYFPEANNFSSTTKKSRESYTNPGFSHWDNGLSPSSTILLIVLTIMSVMIIGMIIRLFCTKCAGTPIPPPATEMMSSTTSSPNSSIWSVPVFSLRNRGESGDLEGSNFPPGFIVSGQQTSRFEIEKDLPPAYEDLFPVEVPKEDSQEIKKPECTNFLHDGSRASPENGEGQGFVNEGCEDIKLEDRDRAASGD